MRRFTWLLPLVAALSHNQVALAATCGNAVREVGEQCDDGNKRDLDACSASCRFEQVLRINGLALQPSTDSVCTANAMGSGFSATALDQINLSIDAAIADGSFSALLPLLGLDDVTGNDDDPALVVGVVDAIPAPAGLVPYDGTDDLDWWYVPVTSEIDPARQPIDQIPGEIAASILVAGPGSATIRLPFGGVLVSAAFSGLQVEAPIGASSTPLASAGDPPGHRIDEQLDPTLQSFASAGEGETGKLCGNLRARSLAEVPIPAAFVGSNCDNQFDGSNTLLDLFVGGCVLFTFQIVAPGQPDQEYAGSPPAGAGPPYTLLLDATSHVNGCKDSGGDSVSLSACLDDAAFSSYFKFALGRVIAIGGDLIFHSGFESGDFTSWSFAEGD